MTTRISRSKIHEQDQGSKMLLCPPHPHPCAHESAYRSTHRVSDAGLCAGSTARTPCIATLSSHTRQYPCAPSDCAVKSTLPWYSCTPARAQVSQPLKSARAPPAHIRSLSERHRECCAAGRAHVHACAAAQAYLGLPRPLCSAHGVRHFDLVQARNGQCRIEEAILCMTARMTKLLYDCTHDKALV
jgi:hypothetical protein